MRRKIDERFLARIWRGQWLDSSRLKTVAGEQVQVIFPGRGNGDKGPDFLEAMVALERVQLLRGAVELHVRTGDWRAHGHHQDPAYNSVILHVTWGADMPWVERQDGVRIPTVPLQGCTSLPIDVLMLMDEPEPPFYGECREVVGRLGPERVGELLDLMGEERFVAKGTYFQGEMACWPAQEVLYQGLMRALGYSKNQAPFHLLAQHLSYSTLERLIGGMSPSHHPLVISALLLGMVVLLPSQGHGDGAGLGRVETNVLEEAWQASLLNQEMRGRRVANLPNRAIQSPSQPHNGCRLPAEPFHGQGVAEWAQ